MRYTALVRTTGFKRTLVAAALVAAYSTVSAMPVFTFDPGAVGLVGSAVTADNIVVSDFTRVTNTSGNTFTENGFLSVAGFQLGGTNLVAGGLNSTYSLYFSFMGNGTTTFNPGVDPRTANTFGTLDDLTFSLIGATGNSTFSTAGSSPSVTSSGTQTLANGSLINGGVSTSPSGSGFVPSANATTSFTVAAGKDAFFSPNPFYNVAFTAFTNAVSTVTPFGTPGAVDSGFTINNGGGDVNFAQPIPEPETYALMMAGLGMLGFMARRRKRG